VFRNDFTNGTIFTTFANFGRIPYGDVYTAELVWSDIDPTGCDYDKLEESVKVHLTGNEQDF